MEYISHSAAETVLIGKKIGWKLSHGGVIAMTGGLGMGKTCLVSGIAAGLGYSGDVSSPTFALVNEYIGGKIPMYHFDMYRVESWDDLYSTGFFDYLDEGAVLAVEWSENIEAALPDDTRHIEIERIDDNTRRIITDF